MIIDPRFDPAATPYTHDQIFVPRPILYAMLGLAAFAVLASGVARATHVGTTREAAGFAGRTVAFRYTIGADNEGAIDLTRSDGTRFHVADAHQDIFPRLMLQSATDLRRRSGADLAAPIELVVDPAGEKYLVDPATHHAVRMSAFGATNAAAFDAVLK